MVNKFTLILVLLALVSISSSASAYSDDGPVVIVEYVSLDLPADDDLKGFRMMAGWTLESGFQIGANLTYYNLNRPSVDGVVQTLDCNRPEDRPFLAASQPYVLEPEFTYWGFGPMLGFDVELIDDWVGFEFMVTPIFPMTNGSAGWSIEIGAFAYLSLEGLTSDWLDLAFMGGIKFGHYDHECDCYRFEENRMMPGLGAMFQF